MLTTCPGNVEKTHLTTSPDHVLRETSVDFNLVKVLCRHFQAGQVSWSASCATFVRHVGLEYALYGGKNSSEALSANALLASTVACKCGLTARARCTLSIPTQTIHDLKTLRPTLQNCTGLPVVPS